LSSAITTIREKQFYSTISKQQRSNTRLTSQQLRLILLLSLFSPLLFLLFFSHIYAHFSCTITN
ncbi:hypothetical protein T08_8839, partial [Trichinella sp. T8]